MIELLFILMFFGFLMFTGVTMVTFFLAIAASLLFVFVVSMVGAVIKLLPWIVVALIGLYIYKHYNKPSSY
ncbi:envelope stress response protein PspG [Vibrio rumoiensis]|uniref:Phage shock protein G n=1 Tax=Vibrio rumoiensis 1S-45 TaxID=1188252 RepID=A0A1E5E1N4_9VIBR|nr:envelope stress response protein PspG [Vibrio rumoiensis]OEF25167.1 phage shock protein G [Vibrio rumoiensis 1S-45]